MKYYLHRYDQTTLDWLWDLAMKRDAPKYGRGKKDYNKALGSVAKHYLGLKGEYAAGVALNLPIDKVVYKGGDPGFDLVKGNRTIDVKISKTFYLIFTPSFFQSDIGLLTRPHNPETKQIGVDLVRDERLSADPAFAWRDVLVIGWIDKANFYKVCEDRHWPTGTKNVVHYRKLFPIRRLNVPD